MVRTLSLRILILLAACACACGALADINTIPPGGTVYIGEEQVDISGSGIGPGAQIAWWAPGTSLDESPADIITVSDPTRFSTPASSFSGREGIWYVLDGKTPVFKIKQPKIGIRVYDVSSDFDATGKWIPKGDTVSFQIETNLHEMRNRPGATGAPVDIIITTPNGASYSSVSGPAGSFSLTGIPVLSSLHDTGPVWSTGGEGSGTYSFRAECTANRLNSNNPAGVSETVTALIQGTNPLMPRESEAGEKAGNNTSSQPSGQKSLPAAGEPAENVSPPLQAGNTIPSSPGLNTTGPALKTPESTLEQTSALVTAVQIPDQTSNQTPNQTLVPVSTPVSSRNPVATETRQSPLPVAVSFIALLLVVLRKS
jgi:hypothetical protein